MSQTNSLSKKTGLPRLFFVLLAAIAVFVAVPLFAEFTTTPVHADGGGTMAGLNAQLTGDPIGDVTPRGFASYFAAPTGSPDPVRQLMVNVSNINLPSGTVLSVALNSSPIGTITLQSNSPSHPCQGFLRLSTANGDTVPAVVAGDTITVGSSDAGSATTYLTGTFAAPPTPSPTATHTPHTPFPTPSHTPFPTPSHTPFPSPTGTPGPARMFAARLNGDAEVPAVTTDGRGCGFVSLNSDETQIRVGVAFRNLSSDVTAVTINGPASTTENGPVIFTLTLPEGNHVPFVTGTFDVTPEQIAELRAGSWYMQVASVNNPDGEIRGQLNGLTPHGGHMGGGPSGNGEGVPSPHLPEGRGIQNDDLPFAVDLDGDGIVDIAQFYPALSSWYLSLSSNATTNIFQVSTRANSRFTVSE